jgi:hypothetical protein
MNIVSDSSVILKLTVPQRLEWRTFDIVLEAYRVCSMVQTTKRVVQRCIARWHDENLKVSKSHVSITPSHILLLVPSVRAIFCVSCLNTFHPLASNTLIQLSSWVALFL